MSEKEVKDIWMGTGDGDQIKLDLSQLESNLQSKTKKMDRTLFWRDSREIFAAIFVSCVFAYKSLTAPEVFGKVTSALYVIWALYVIYRLLDVRKYKKVADLGQSFKNQLLQQKYYLEQQAGLLDNALSWYIGPFAFISTISILGSLFSGVPTGVSFLLVGLMLVLIYFFSRWLYRINKKAAKTAFTPLIENIDNVLTQLDEDLV